MAPDANIVFIVDDEPSICAALTRLFKSVGLASRSFCCAREFMDQAPKLGPGCLILDHLLPDLSGLEVQAELARAGIGLPIIFHTAHGSRSLRAKALQAGAAGSFLVPKLHLGTRFSGEAVLRHPRIAKVPKHSLGQNLRSQVQLGNQRKKTREKN